MRQGMKPPNLPVLSNRHVNYDYQCPKKVSTRKLLPRLRTIELILIDIDVRFNFTYAPQV